MRRPLRKRIGGGLGFEWCSWLDLRRRMSGPGRNGAGRLLHPVYNSESRRARAGLAQTPMDIDAERSRRCKIQRERTPPNLMAYCSRCGAMTNDDARFCPQCGQPSGFAAAPPAASIPLSYTIQGDNLQVVRVKLAPGHELYAEAGKMLYKTPSVQWETRMSGGTIGEKLWGALKRTVMGE
ncbi:MAG: zinc-ribbon domain-containing protein, partial [Acidobacteria bacterium]|nr:zinc-ribbon domain-containing protein [Acidobacteriota bacterium]